MADAESSENTKFRLFLSNNEVLVWDKDTILTLREKYRIVGSLIGSLPSKPRQNVLYSVPLVLQREEVTLLVEKKLATVVVSSYKKPTQAMVKCFQSERQENIDEQIKKLNEIKRDKLEEFAEVIEEGRVKKRTKRSNLKRKISDPSVGEDSKKQRCDEDDLKDENDEASSGVELKHPATADLEDYKDSTLVHVNTETPRPLLNTVEVIWTFPVDAQETLRYTVYRNLWEKGYYITQASKFGGDYLVYPNDPFRFHSYFVVTVVPWKERFSPLQLVAIGRLGSSVKKTSVLASVDSTGLNVIYTSIQWPGFT